jgi:hypothetical protein
LFGVHPKIVNIVEPPRLAKLVYVHLPTFKPLLKLPTAAALFTLRLGISLFGSVYYTFSMIQRGPQGASMLARFPKFTQNSEPQTLANPSELRQQERIVPLTEGEWVIEILAQGETISAQLLDFSPFGMGASCAFESHIDKNLAVGEMFSLVCFFGSLKFPSKAKLVNKRVLDQNGSKQLRLGFSLVSESSPTHEKLEHRRSELRLLVDKHMSPMCVCEDEYVFSERMFMRVLDMSASGFALELPTPRVPFLPGQRRWLSVIIPFLGEFKCFVRIAYVRKMPQSDITKTASSAKGAEVFSHMVGVTFLKSIVDISQVLSDYIFYTHPEFDRSDMVASGFSREDFSPWDFRLRPRLVLSGKSERSGKDSVDLKFETSAGILVAEMTCQLNEENQALEVTQFSTVAEVVSSRVVKHRLGVALARFLLVYSHVQLKSRIDIEPQFMTEIQKILGVKSTQLSVPNDFVEQLSPLLCLELSSLFVDRIKLAPHVKGQLLSFAGGISSFIKGHIY